MGDIKILHVSEPLVEASGVTTFLVALNRELNARGIKSFVVSINQSLPDCDYDIIHIHGLWRPTFHRVARNAFKKNKCVVWSPHGMLTPWSMNNKKWKKILAWRLYQKHDLASADLIHATAQSEVKDIKRLGLKNKVVVAPLGVEINDCVEHVEHADGKKVLLFVSRVQKKKGLVNLVHAWSGLKQQLHNSNHITSNWRIRIVGPDEDNHTAELKRLCLKLKVEDDIEFVGPKYGDELVREYASADLFVLPTFSENFGSVVIESLAHGVPVICTKGAPWDELETHKCGWWIDVGAEPLAKTLAEAMSLSDNARRQMGERGRKLVEEKYTWGAVVKKMVEGYRSIVARS